MSNQSLGRQVAANLLESLQQDSTVNSRVSKSSVGIVMEENQKLKTSFGEEAAKAYQAKASKLRPSLLPVEAVVEGAKAMQFGAQKYGVDQWREVDMQRREFIDALERHLIALKQGETHASDSNVSHLGHIIANAGIILAKYGK